MPNDAASDRSMHDALKVLVATNGIMGLAEPRLVVCEDGYTHITWQSPGCGHGNLEVGEDDWWWSFRGVDARDDYVEEIAQNDTMAVLVKLEALRAKDEDD